MKSNDSQNNNDDFLFILRHKLRNRTYQFEFQKNHHIFITIKLATLTKQSNNVVIANILIIDQNEKVFDRQRDIFNFALSRFLMNRVLKSKKFFMKLRESIIA